MRSAVLRRAHARLRRRTPASGDGGLKPAATISSQLDPTRYTPFFSYRKGKLHCESVSLERVAERIGTPVYVYSRAAIELAGRQFQLAFSRRGLPHTICYAVKANSNLSILQLFARMGCGFDIVSGGELYRLLRIGVHPNRMVFSGVGKTREEMRDALRAGIRLFNVESAAELDLLAKVAAGEGRPAPAAIRVNPDVEAGAHPHISTGRQLHKFGVDWRDARELYRRYLGSPWIDWRGISMHIGSQILSIAPFRRALSRLVDYVKELRRGGIPLRHVDFGGGLGIRYAGEHPPDFEEYAGVVAEALKPLGCHLLLEPGRALVGQAGVVLTRVLYSKTAAGGRKHFVVVDAAMNDFLRPALYDAIHPVTHVVPPERRGRIRADIVGPVCETGDSFLQDWPIEPAEAGDLLVLWGAGAYGFVSASNYNSRQRPAEVLVEGKRFRVIRRRESRGDLVRGE